jgi:RNase H-fold protein (predicted Holliday junction resolvase)
VGPVDDLVSAWPGIVRTLKATVRALYSAVDVIGMEGDTLVVGAPSDMHKKKCLELADQVRSALTSAAGRPISLEVRVQSQRATSAEVSTRSSTASKGDTDHTDGEGGDDEAPIESVVDQIAKSFPGARIVDSSTS